MTQKEDSSTKGAENVIVVPDDDTLLASIDKSLATTSTSEAGPSSVADEEPMDTDEVISKSSAKSPSSPKKEGTNSLFEHKRMAFGLCNAPATFQRVIQFVLHPSKHF